jgi:uncharacterized membrane protein (UPF0127 family)
VSLPGHPGGVRALWIGGKEVLPRVRLLDRFWARVAGLAGRPPPPDGQAVALRPCRAVHTCGMRYPIDILFLDRSDRVLRTVRGLPPWRVADGGPGACTTVEWPAGRVDPSPWLPGETARWT